MDVNVKQILSDLKRKHFEPVYFLQGEETYYIDLIADYVENHVLTDAEKGFNQVVVYGKDVTMATILTHARRFPMMAERQVVLVKEAQDIQDLNKENGSKLLLDYLTKQVPSTILVFCHKHKSLDKRRELGKKIDQYAVTLNTRKMYENQLPEFVREYVQERKISMDDRAVQVLCEHVGNDLHRLTNEIDKLTIALSPGVTITVEHVMNQVGISKEYNIFELQKAILTRDALLANKIVNYYVSNTKKNPIIPAVAYLFSFFAKLLMATQASDKTEKGIASELKMSPYAARDYTVALRLFPPQKIMDNISCLKEADLKLKGVNVASADDGQTFRELIWRLMN